MSETAEILLVEDNHADVRLTKEALKEARIATDLNVVNLGTEAKDFLNQRGKYDDAPQPDLVLLDLRLPDMDGSDILETIKTDSGQKPIQVITLSGSDNPERIVASYKKYADAHLKKPIDGDEFMAVLKTLDGFWFEIVRDP